MRASICTHDLQYGFYRLSRAFCTMDDDAITLSTGNKLIEICIQMLDHIRADRVCLLTPLTPIGKRLQRADASLHAAFSVGIQCNLKCWACYGLTDACSKFCGHFEFNTSAI